MLPLATLTSVPNVPNIVPTPVSFSQDTRVRPFFFRNGVKLVTDTKASRPLETMFMRAAGLRLNGDGSAGRVVFRRMSDTRRLRPDWYTMEVTPTTITVDYTSEAGAFYAVQTLRQLLPKNIESQSVMKGVQWSVPACTISDGPRFGWRGLMLDVSRHFFPISYIKKTLDRMALLKMNKFHWHLVDDGGWRVQIDAYPKLTSYGAWRLDTKGVWPAGNWNFGNIQFVGDKDPDKYGGFYTKKEIRDVIKYAAARHIEVVPEIEMPGHSLCAIVSYPELMCDKVPAASKSGMSISNVYCAGNDKAIKFLESVLKEVCELFPSQYVHIGADEVMKDFWKKCPKCQKRMLDNNLKNEHELQSWFVRHFDTFLASKGRRLVGWDEILEGGLAPGATVMSWRGIDGGVAAAKAGRDVVMSPTSHCYFDYSYKDISTQKVYGWDPVPANLSAQEASHILGGQYNLWAEWIATEEKGDKMQFPRALAMATVLWSPKEKADWDSFQAPMYAVIERLKAMGVGVTD